MGCGCGGSSTPTSTTSGSASTSTIKYALRKPDGSTTEPVDTRAEAEAEREPGDKLRVLRVTA